MRIHYQEKLASTRGEVIRMGLDANDMVRGAVDAVISGNGYLGQQVVQADDRVDSLERDLLRRAILIVMQEAPVATDLRLLVATLGVIGEIEKVGDQACKLVRRADRLSGAFPAELRLALSEIGELARRQFSAAIRLFSEYDPVLAREVIEGDFAVDEAFSDARARVLKRLASSPEEGEQLLYVVECFHALEHVADHAVAIAVRLKMVYEAEAGAEV